MRQTYEIRKPIASRLHITPRPLQERRIGRQNQSSSRPSTSLRKLTFGAKINDLSKSNVSLMSSSSSRAFTNDMTISRVSFETPRIYANHNRFSFNQRLEDKNQFIRNIENEDAMLPLVRKTQSNIEQDLRTFQALTKKISVQPILDQSIVLKTIDEVDPPSPQIIKQYQITIEEKDAEILILRQELEANKISYEQQLANITANRNSLENTVAQLNQIIFDLRNNKEYQTDIIAMLEERWAGLITERDALIFENQKANEELKILDQRLYNVFQEDLSFESYRQSIRLLEIEVIEHKKTIEQLENKLDDQGALFKDLRRDLIDRNRKVAQLQKFIEQANLLILNEHLGILNNQIQEDSDD